MSDTEPTIREKFARQLEENAVRDLGEHIGYGNMMQLAERLWNEAQPGGAHSVGCCVAFLVPCPCVDRVDRVKCDWCCGAGRVTKRVAEEVVKSLSAAAREARSREWYAAGLCSRCGSEDGGSCICYAR